MAGFGVRAVSQQVLAATRSAMNDAFTSMALSIASALGHSPKILGLQLQLKGKGHFGSWNITRQANTSSRKILCPSGTTS